jgi:periplasmic protein TonB
MSTTPSHSGKPEQPQQAATSGSTGHLTVRPEGLGPRDTFFQFEKQEKRIGGAVGISVAAHVGVLALLVLIARFVPEQVYEAVLPERLSKDIVWLAQPGPGGGGGGGNKMPEPPKPAEIPKPTPPAPIPEVVPPPTVETPPQEVAPQVPVITQAANEPVVGVLSENTSANTESRGTGTGSGAGPGTGRGIGPGNGGGIGGGEYRVGNGVTSPTVLREVKPGYTADAMRAKVQGTVRLECVVLPDGTVGRVEVIRSLDNSFGLDQEAIKAAKQWRFRPGMRQGEPVAVLVIIELDFTLR